VFCLHQYWCVIFMAPCNYTLELRCSTTRVWHLFIVPQCIRSHLVCLHPWFVIFTALFDNTSELWGCTTQLTCCALCNCRPASHRLLVALSLVCVCVIPFNRSSGAWVTFESHRLCFRLRVAVHCGSGVQLHIACCPQFRASCS